MRYQLDVRIAIPFPGSNCTIWATLWEMSDGAYIIEERVYKPCYWESLYELATFAEPWAEELRNKHGKHFKENYTLNGKPFDIKDAEQDYSDMIEEE